MEMNFEISKIAKKDYIEILNLWNNELDNRSVDSENIAIFYTKMSVDDRYQTFVARVDNQVVGFITSIHSFAVGLEGGFVHITGLAVKENWQHQGIGTKLLNYHENYARKMGVTSILLNSGIRRENAHTFYEKNGFSKDSYCFDKSL